MRLMSIALLCIMSSCLNWACKPCQPAVVLYRCGPSSEQVASAPLISEVKTQKPGTQSAPAEEAKLAVDPEDPMGWLNGLSKAAKNGEWSLVAGFCLLFLTLLLDRLTEKVLKKKIPRGAVPWIAMGLGVLGQAGLFLAMGYNITYAISGGLVSGLIASGGYSAVGRHLPLARRKP